MFYEEDDFIKLPVLITLITALMTGGIVYIALSNTEGKALSYESMPINEIKLKEKDEKINRPYTEEVIIGAIGDVLLHDRVYEDAETEDGYDFMPMIKPVEEEMKEPDFLMANQESLPGGEELGLSGYPMFNSPVQIVDDLQQAGVDFLSLANNHSLDTGLEGINNTIDYLNSVDMPYTGVYESWEDYNEERIINVKGIDIGLLSYTYGTNGIPVPEGHEYAVSMLRYPEMLEKVRLLEDKVDVLIVHAHWGEEYARLPNDEQKWVASQFAEAGADIIIGHHPHVLQPIEKLETKDGREAVVFYSLGNYLSGQVFEYTDIGGIAEIKLEKEINGNSENVVLKNPKILPTFVQHEDHDNHRVITLEEAFEKGYTEKDPADITAHIRQFID
ncbi:CapA family protein [Alkalicoccus halolimnae]|uniref:CapA family protein n=1 Tax=Alkalicoccus halolimnae TaxID=1667239 RepID=A0A5C7FJH3_9BACI|nr:CapA family protein [Alkalicoccus halolimnae]